MLDIAYSKPNYWPENMDRGTRWIVHGDCTIEQTCDSFLDRDYCAIENRDFFIRGIIPLPIIGSSESFCWGVWGSVSRANFEKFLRDDAASHETSLPMMFSWLSNKIADYPDTLSLKMDVCPQASGLRPHFHLQPSDHPLSQEFNHGIEPARIREIMLRRLSAIEQ